MKGYFLRCESFLGIFWIINMLKRLTVVFHFNETSSSGSNNKNRKSHVFCGIGIIPFAHFFLFI